MMSTTSDRMVVELQTVSGELVTVPMDLAVSPEAICVASRAHQINRTMSWRDFFCLAPERYGIREEEAGSANTVGQWLAAQELARKAPDCDCHRCRGLADELRLARNNLRVGMRDLDAAYRVSRLREAEKALSRTLNLVSPAPDGPEGTAEASLSEALRQADEVLDRKGDSFIGVAHKIIKDALGRGA